jgi:SAM-dependent methyltransferase
MPLRNLLYKLAWDTRCRNVDVRGLLRQFPGASILDAGCGEYGLAAFMPRSNITGADILPVESVDPQLHYKYGSITNLPFENGAFDVAVSVDVLEHLPQGMRAAAVNELVRVARKAVVIAFPSGRAARRMDEMFASKLSASGQPMPDWLEEHLAQPYPDTENIIAAVEKAAAKDGRNTAISVSYSEHLSVARFLRSWASRSKYCYVAANLLSGMLSPLMPNASAESSYRLIVVAELAK